jgi:hypothetical protein
VIVEGSLSLRNHLALRDTLRSDAALRDPSDVDDLGRIREIWPIRPRSSRVDTGDDRSPDAPGCEVRLWH